MQGVRRIRYGCARSLRLSWSFRGGPFVNLQIATEARILNRLTLREG
jgi:hypothetical protein